MDEAARAAAARSLSQAYASRVPVPPLTGTYDDIALEDSYAVQLLQIEQLRAQGRTVVGHKVGLTSVAMQRLLDVAEPDFGHLLDDFFYLEHETVPVQRFLAPRIEPEVAFVLGRPLEGPGVAAPEAIAAVDFVLPALEIVDSRIKDWKITLLDTVADNASSGAVVLGSTPTRLDAVDLRLTGGVMTRNGSVVGTGAGGAVLGSPVSSLVWLANTLGLRGVRLEAGHVVLSGAVCAMVPVAPGDTFTATFAGLGSVTARFTQQEEEFHE